MGLNGKREDGVNALGLASLLFRSHNIMPDCVPSPQVGITIGTRGTKFNLQNAKTRPLFDYSH